MTIKEAIERIRSLLGQPTQSPLYPKEEILDYLDLAILKTITSLSTFCDEYLHISLIRFRLNANENKVNLSTLEFSPQFGALVKPIFRIKSVRVNGRYAQKEDLNEIFAKMTFMPTTSGDTWYYAVQGLSILWFYPIPTQRVECEVYYIGLPTSLKTLPETTDLSTIIHPATYDSII
ncbi:MAG: hypothetical protein NZ608_07045, partial [candidate division WOR-3 bacterium]|nr:hypothetical protein [candidate division WOR-3 bacterium]